MQNQLRHAIVDLDQITPTLVGPVLINGGTDLTIQNINDTGYIYIGDESVSLTSYGFRILANTAISFELPGNATVYAVGSEPNMQAATIMTGLEIGS